MLLALLAALALAGCGSSGGGSLHTSAGGSGGSGGPGGPVSSSTISVKDSDYGGRCPPLGWSSDSGTRIATADIDVLVVCPQVVPNGNQHVVRLSRGDSRFDALVQQLGRPSVRPRGGQICPAFATPTQYVLASAGGSWYVVDLPTDACGHYLAGLYGLLNRLRS